MTSRPHIPLDELRQQVAACHACPLCETRTQTVFGDGNPNARVLIHQPAMEGMQGQASDIAIVADELERMSGWLCDTLAAHTGKTSEEIAKDIQRDKILTAPQAKEYGLVDQVLEPRKAQPNA